MHTTRIIILVLAILSLPAHSFAAKTSTKVNLTPAQTTVATPDDTTPPTISITTPEVKRGLKVVAKEQTLTVTGRAEDASGVATVTVNGQQAALDEKGNFSAELLLKVGENQITVEALDIHRNRATERFIVSRTTGAPPVVSKTKPAVSPTAKGRDYALIIGINGYKHLDRLKTAVKDATVVAKVLKEQYGFDTRLLLDNQATRDAILKELNQFRKKLTSDDRLLVYYAGHGTFEKDTDTAYWLPIDAEKDETTKWIEAKSITDELKRISSRQVLVVADSCYSGTLTRKATTDLSANDTRENYLQKLMAKPARVLIASGGNEPVADSGGKGHSVFADAFIRALRNPGRDIFTAEELLTNHLKESVAGRADQTPEYKVIKNSGHDGGDFVFTKQR